MGGISTLQIPDQKAPRGLSGVTMKQLLVDRVLFPDGEMDQCLQKMGNMRIRVCENRIVPYHGGFDVRTRDCGPIEKGQAPLQRRIETREEVNTYGWFFLPWDKFINMFNPHCQEVQAGLNLG